MAYKFTLDVNELKCLALEFLRVCDNKDYIKAELIIDDEEILITPITEQIKIVFSRK